jgi:hypothetical protein
MAQKVRTARTLIVDACVARSAGLTDHPVSAACRTCLEAILEICHKVATTVEIKEEWDRHMSNYTRKWRRSMAARKKALVPVAPDPISLRMQDFSSKSQIEIAKDLRLIESAFAVDRIIVTNDNALLDALRETEEGQKLLSAVVWINPVSDPRAIEILQTMAGLST